MNILPVRLNTVNFKGYDNMAPHQSRYQQLLSDLLNNTTASSDTFKKQKKPDENTYQWALDWNETSRKKELDDKCESDIKNLSFWKKHFTDRPDEIRQAYKDKLASERTSVNAILKSMNHFQGEVVEQEKLKQKNQDTIQKIEEEKKLVSKLNNAAEIASAFRIKNKGNLDDRIGGYEDEKFLLREGKGFINQIALEKAGLEANIPNSILLFGVIGTGKTTFANAIADETGCKIIEISEDSTNFMGDVREALTKARQNYINKKQRSIIIVNETDLHLSDNKENRRNIATMKGVLDSCAQLPNDKSKNASAATFIFTTNHPLDIDDEIVMRDEKVGQTIMLEPAEGENIKEVVKFYMKKCDPNKKIIDWDNYDYSNIIQTFNPNMKDGAYSNDRLKMMVQDAYEEYKENNGSDFEEILLGQSDKNSRNILPKRLKQYQDDLYMLCRKDYHTDDND